MRWLGVAVMAVGGIFLVLAGVENVEEAVILGAGLQAGGLWLWEKLRYYRDTRAQNVVPEAPRDDKIERLQATLLNLQDDMAKMREDREFYQKLYGSESRKELEPQIR